MKIKYAVIEQTVIYRDLIPITDEKVGVKQFKKEVANGVHGHPSDFDQNALTTVSDPIVIMMNSVDLDQ